MAIDQQNETPLEKTWKQKRAKRKEARDWDKIATISGVIASFLVAIGFLWTFHSEVVELTRKTSLLEGKIEILINQAENNTKRGR